jgi:CHAT domain-containing protein
VLLHREQYPAALAEISAAMRLANPSSAWSWRLRLLRAETLLEQKELKLADQALDFEFPTGPQWTAERARYRLCQATIEYRRRNYEKAWAGLDRAQALAGAAGAAPAAGILAQIELRRASVAVAQKKFPDADTMLRHVLTDAANRNDPYLQMKATVNMGYMLLRAFRWEEAIPWSETGLKMAQAVQATDDEARSKLNLGWCYYELGDPVKAQHYFEEAALGFGRIGNRQDGHVALGNIASTMYTRHDYQSARSNYEKALEVATKLDDRENRADWLTNLAKIGIETGDWNGAEHYNNEAWAVWKALGDHSREAYAIANAGYIAAGRNDFGKAEELFRTAMRTASGDPAPLLNASVGLAHALAGEGKDREAEAAYRDTDAAMERQRASLVNDEDKLIYFSSLAYFYQDYIEYLIKRSRSRDALEIAESSRARALLDRLRVANVHNGHNTAAGFQKVAAAYHSVLLSYWLGPQNSYLWVVTSSGVKEFPLPPADRIRSMVENYDAFIQHTRDPLTTENPAARQLFDTLIAPARAFLPKGAHIIIVPDGPLYALNFETLPVPGATPHYWIEDVALSVTPSLDLLSLENAPRSRTSPSLLLIGNPVSPVPQYPALEFAGQEMAAIQRNLAAFHPLVREGADADPDAYTHSNPGRFTLIHFVAHAVANPDDPLESAVILSRHGAEYKLRARDVLETHLTAELVTISACRSAGARIYAGEGLVGLTWAFLQAGAKNVIAGLWDVDDRSTAQLAGRLYAEIARGAAPADALRAAKLELIHAGGTYRKPYYWGPFQLYTRQPK